MEIKNQHTIDDLAREIGSENVPMLLDIFLNELQEYLDILNRVEGNELHQNLREISHALKSSAASFGADALCFSANGIDSKIKQDQLDSLDSDVQIFIQLIGQTREVYQSLY